MRRAFVLAIVAAVAAGAFGAGHAASNACNSGEVTPGTTPLGIGVEQSGDPASGAGSLTVCNTGNPIPPPLKGSATISGNANTQSGYGEIDGDSNNNSADCTDGFARVAADGEGPHFYEAPNGSYADTDPATGGNQQAQEVGPDVFVQDTAANCAPA